MRKPPTPNVWLGATRRGSIALRPLFELAPQEAGEKLRRLRAVGRVKDRATLETGSILHEFYQCLYPGRPGARTGGQRPLVVAMPPDGHHESFALFEHLCERIDYTKSEAMYEIRTYLVLRMLQESVLPPSDDDDDDDGDDGESKVGERELAGRLSLSCYKCFISLVNAHAQSQDWAAWSWDSLRAWIDAPAQKTLYNRMLAVWYCARDKAANESGGSSRRGKAAVAAGRQPCPTREHFRQANNELRMINYYYDIPVAATRDRVTVAIDASRSFAAPAALVGSLAVAAAGRQQPAPRRAPAANHPSEKTDDDRIDIENDATATAPEHDLDGVAGSDHDSSNAQRYGDWMSTMSPAISSPRLQSVAANNGGADKHHYDDDMDGDVTIHGTPEKRCRRGNDTHDDDGDGETTVSDMAFSPGKRKACPANDNDDGRSTAKVPRYRHGDDDDDDDDARLVGQAETVVGTTDMERGDPLGSAVDVARKRTAAGTDDDDAVASTPLSNPSSTCWTMASILSLAAMPHHEYSVAAAAAAAATANGESDVGNAGHKGKPQQQKKEKKEEANQVAVVAAGMINANDINNDRTPKRLTRAVATLIDGRTVIERLAKMDVPQRESGATSEDLEVVEYAPEMALGIWGPRFHARSAADIAAVWDLIVTLSHRDTSPPLS